jgi:hypothetical protein
MEMKVKQNFCFLDARPDAWQGPLLQTRGQKIAALLAAVLFVIIVVIFIF